MPTVKAPLAQQQQRAQILSYLRSAPRVAGADDGKTVPCRYASCAFAPLSAAERGDDAWRWPETMAHYVDVHGLALPAQMVAHFEERGFLPPEAAGTGPSSDRAWQGFAQVHDAKPPPALRGFGSEMSSRADGPTFIHWEGRDIELTPEVQPELDRARAATTLGWIKKGLQDHLDAGLRPVGYWASSKAQEQVWLPWPHELVDEAWEGADRARIAGYLKSGRTVQSWHGTSRCRFPPCTSGGCDDLSDGVFVWPADLHHYVSDHHVRLPADVVDHMRSRSWRL